MHEGTQESYRAANGPRSLASSLLKLIILMGWVSRLDSHEKSAQRLKQDVLSFVIERYHSYMVFGSMQRTYQICMIYVYMYAHTLTLTYNYIMILTIRMLICSVSKPFSDISRSTDSSKPCKHLNFLASWCHKCSEMAPGSPGIFTKCHSNLTKHCLSLNHVLHVLR